MKKRKAAGRLKKRKAAGKRAKRLLGVITCVLLVTINYTESVRMVAELPSTIYIGEQSQKALESIKNPFEFKLPGVYASADNSETLGNKQEYKGSVELFGLIPVKQVTLSYREQITLVPGGHAIGVTMHTNGALVVGKGNIETREGKQVCPAEEAGIEPGDVVVYANGKPVSDAASLVEICAATQGSINLGVERNGELMYTTITPAADKRDGALKLGMWVRDSTSGIGTLSFCMQDSPLFGALGHAVMDVDTGSVLNVREGELFSAMVIGVSQGTLGTPGELHGVFATNGDGLGQITKNTECGIFGTLQSVAENPLYPNGLLLAYPDEAEIGTAQLLTTVDEQGIQVFDCEIIRLYPNATDSKQMVLKITDERLLARTGGIVQGM